LGGANNDFGNGAAFDSAGNALLIGQTESSNWVSGGFDTTYGGDDDAYLVKLDVSGAHLWSTYVGGANGDDGVSVSADSRGNVFATGFTASAGWVDGGFDTTLNGLSDGYVLKLGADGAHAWSTYFGGSNYESSYAIATDDSGNVVVSGSTQSTGWIADGYDLTYGGGTDVFLLRISDPVVFIRRDLASFVRNYGMVSGASTVNGDFTGDGRVDLRDLLFLKQHYLSSAPSPAARDYQSTLQAATDAAIAGYVPPTLRARRGKTSFPRSFADHDDNPFGQQLRASIRREHTDRERQR
jgi:hypothetical protein